MKVEKIKAYGTEEETIVETAKGIYLIQSPDMTVEYEELKEIPEGFEPCTLPLDLDLPGDILENEEPTRIELFFLELELAGNTDKEVVAGLGNGAIDKPEWMAVKELSNGAIYTDAEDEKSPAIIL